MPWYTMPLKGDRKIEKGSGWVTPDVRGPDIERTMPVAPPLGNQKPQGEKNVPQKRGK
jgi:hypothetical protein